MAQNGFAFFFLAVLIGCSISLTAWMRLHWSRIVAAARAELPESRPLTYKAVQRRPIEIPYVAQRMLAQAGQPAGATVNQDPPLWTFTNRRANGHQLAFGF